jgi:hypothetical protein
MPNGTETLGKVIVGSRGYSTLGIFSEDRSQCLCQRGAPCCPNRCPPASALKVLKDKGVIEFFHASTVRTSITFLKSGGLLSREQGEKDGQTSQITDATDKVLGIWDKVFVDTLDIHERLNKRH